MNLRKLLSPAFIGLFLLSFAADARYILVIPPPGTANPVIKGFSEQFNPMVVGADIPIPANTFQALTNLTATKVILVADNTTAPVSFLSILNGQLSGPARPLILDNKPARAAALTPDGKRLVVLAGNGSGSGSLYVVDLGTPETIVLGGGLPMPAQPTDLVVTADSRLAYVLSSNPGTLTVVDLNSRVIVSQTPIASVSGNLAISISPTDSVYVTASYSLIEYFSGSPYTERARSQLLSHPGKLHFSPNGRYALASDSLGAFSTLVTLDLGTKPTATSAGIQLSTSLVPSYSSIVRPVDDIEILNDNRAIVYVGSSHQLYDVTYLPSLYVSEYSPSVTNASGIAVSNEFPTARSLYYNAAGGVSLFDTSSQMTVGPNAMTPGLLSFIAAPSDGQAAGVDATSIIAYGGGQTVAPGAQLRPYAVRVADVQGRPIYNTLVNYVVESAGVVLSRASAATNMYGYALVTATAPQASGEFAINATAGSATVRITSTVTGGTSGGGGGGTDPTGPQMIRVSGDGQLVPSFSGFANPLVLKLVDAKGAPLPLKQVTWTSQPDVNVTPATTVTDAKGLTETTVSLGVQLPPNAAYQTSTITATSEFGSTVYNLTTFPRVSFDGKYLDPPQVFLLKPTSENRTLTVKLGSTTEDAVRIQVANVNLSTPIPNVALNVSTGNTDPKLGITARCAAGIPLTDTSGIASCNLIAEGRLGTTTLFISGGADPILDGAQYAITLNVTPGDPVAPVIKQGNNQTGKPGTTLPFALLVGITDSVGNTLPGTPVTWTVLPSTAATLSFVSSVSDTNGSASARVTLGQTPGKFQVKVTAGGKDTFFDLTVDAQISGITKVSGDNQPAAVINQPFASPLIVQVNDVQNRPVAGTAVQWAVTSGIATISAASVPTGADGRSQVTVTAGATPGPITVTATVTGFPAISFQLQSRLPGPTLTAASFVNWATNEPGLAPGNLVLITGAGLAPNLKGTVAANVLTGSLPYSLSDVSVKLTSAGREAYAPIYRVSNENNVESVLIQVPFEIAGTTADAVITVSGGTTAVTGITVRPASPGILENVISGRRIAAAVRSDGLFVTPETPARRGETIRIYTIGLGQTNPPLDNNRVGSVDQLVNAVVTVGINGAGVTTTSVHTAENLVGVYEVEFIVPATAQIGSTRDISFLLVAPSGQVFYSNPSIFSISE